MFFFIKKFLSNCGDNYFKFTYVLKFEFDSTNNGGLKNDVIAIEHTY